jgi:hypothetical protein
MLSSRMPRIYRTLILSSLAAMTFLFQVNGQSVPPSKDALKDILLQRGDEMMAAWKRHDSAGIASTLAPDFVSVGGDAMATGFDATIKGLMNCTLTSYRITESNLKQLSSTAAVLITRQEQQITCSGHPAPAVMNMTDTYVKRNGKWLILIHTEASVGTQ